MLPKALKGLQRAQGLGFWGLGLNQPLGSGMTAIRIVVTPVVRDLPKQRQDKDLHAPILS